MRAWAWAFLLGFLGFGQLGGFAPAAADGPLVTADAETEVQGQLTLMLGAAVRDEARDFGLPDRERQWEIGRTRLLAGLGPFIEARLSGVALLALQTRDGSENDFGDWTLGTKIRFLSEKGRRPALGFLYEVKLPNASNEKGGGTDETDFFATLLLSKSLGERHRLHANAGIGVLGDPSANASQNDVLVLHLAWERRIGAGDALGLELLTEDGPETRDSPRLLRGVYRHRLGRWGLHFGLGVGLNDDADGATFDFGLRRTFQWGKRR